METNLFSISKIFTEKILRIPDYQRGYAWREKHLKDFWNDIEQLEFNKNHYVGVLTLEKVLEDKYSTWEDDIWIIESKNYEPFYIVDGQQRLTTTIILIQSIIETVDEGDKLNFNTPGEIQKKFLFDSKDDGISRSYLFGYEVDNPSYEFLKNKIFNENTISSDTKQETIYTNNLLLAKEFFTEKLSKLNKKEIEIIYKKITQNFLFNLYVMSSDVDVYVAFETMNNRGKPLSHLELLKNRLIYLSTKLNNKHYEIKKLRTSINECWKVIYHQLGRNKDKPLDDDLFLHNHFIIYFDRENVTNRNEYYNYRHYRNIYQDSLLENIFTTKNIINGSIDISYIYEYVNSLKHSVETWYQILNPNESNFIIEEKYWLNRINKLSIDSCTPSIISIFSIRRRYFKKSKVFKNTGKKFIY